MKIFDDQNNYAMFVLNLRPVAYLSKVIAEEKY